MDYLYSNGSFLVVKIYMHNLAQIGRYTFNSCLIYSEVPILSVKITKDKPKQPGFFHKFTSLWRGQQTASEYILKETDGMEMNDDLERLAKDIHLKIIEKKQKTKTL